MAEQQRVAALQMVSGRDLDHNLQTARRLIRQGAEGGATVLVLPEVFAQFSTRDMRALAEAEAGPEAPVQQFLRQCATEFGVWLVGGTVPLLNEPDDGKVAAASLVINPAGECVARYDKVHLFDVDVGDKQGSYRESDTFSAGGDTVVVDSPVGRLGLSVCYDLRFPEMYRRLLDEGAEVFVVPGAFTRHTGLAHWLPLLRARAIENQCYVVGANQGGQHSRKRFTSGGSVIIDPWGRVLAEAAYGEAVVSAPLDREKLKKIRRAMPVQQHRRFK